jgi:hypothetical protein
VSRIKTVAKRWPVLLFVLVVLLSGITAYHYAYYILDSDAASELVLGNLLANENTIVSADWLYGSEIRLFNSNLIYMPLFKLFSDWQTVRFVSILVFQLLLAGSYFYLSRRMKISLNAYFLSASLLLLPASVVYGRLGLYHNYYTPCFIYGFLIAGLYLSLIEHKGQKRTWQITRLLAMLLLTLMTCMNGFRQLPAAMIPLFMTALIVALKEHRSAPDTLAELSKPLWKNALLAFAVLAAGFAALYVHSHVLPKYFQFRILDTSVVALPSVDNFRNLLAGYLSLFGFQEGRTLFSAEGLLALGGAFAAVVLLIISLQDIVPRTKPTNFPGSFMGTLYPVAMLCMTLTFLLLDGNDNYPQYYLTAFVWIFPYLGWQADALPASFRRITLRQALVALACLCLFANGVYNDFYYQNPDDKQVQYDPGIDIHTLDHLQGAIHFIEENELEVGYAYFWDSSIVTEATDGRVTMISIDYDTENNVLAYHDFLTDLKWQQEDFVEDKSVFLLATIAHSGFFSATELAQYSVLAYEDAYYRVYIFDFSTDVWDNLNLINVL